MGEYTFAWGLRTYVMGILNVSPDSFSGDGVDRDVHGAVAQAASFADLGADIIDLGGQSTRPGHIPISPEEELHRVLPVLEALIREIDLPISIDTDKPQVAQEAIRLGAHCINDVSGLRNDPALAVIAADAKVPLVLMHNQIGTNYNDLVGDVIRGLEWSVLQALDNGVQSDKIIVDPGIGFGKTPRQNLALLRDLSKLRRLGYPILIGPSRKSVIGGVLDLPVEDRMGGTAAAIAIGIANGADIVRVHDVGDMVRVARMSDSIVRRPPEHLP